MRNDPVYRIKIVRYEDFGAVGDGKTDDGEAIVKAHAFANDHDLPVKAGDDATYYISGEDRTAVIMTDTDFGTARFIIDDTEVESRGSKVSVVKSRQQTLKIDGLASLKKGQSNLGITLPSRCIVTVKNDNVKHYIRKGLNQNKGTSQLDLFLVNPDGSVDPETPIIWDFETITSAEARPVDTKPLTVKGGHFTTIANRAPSKYTYYQRGFAVQRSNVVVDGMEHHIRGEGDTGAPYAGFIQIGNCANVTVRNSQFSGRKTYRTIGSAGRPVSMGSYGIHLTKALNITFLNCTQINDINDRSRWGIMSSNFCKNLTYGQCTLSRFDAHQGLWNGTIRNSTIGHAGINAIGGGTFLVENTTLHSPRLVALRGDYGSTWNGDFVFRNSVFQPPHRPKKNLALIVGANSGDHDFGYTCTMPRSITIGGLAIDDENHGEIYQGPVLFDSNLKPTPEDAKFPYVPTEEVTLKNVTTASPSFATWAISRCAATTGFLVALQNRRIFHRY